MRPPRFSAGLLLAAWAWRAFAGSEPSSAEASTGPERLKENVRVTIDTNAPPAAVTETNVEKRFSVQASWQGWDGLHLELNQHTRLPNPAGPLTRFIVSSNALPPICLDQVQMTLNLGARIEVDGAAFLTSGAVPDFANGVELRRALFTASGDCILVFPVSYEVQVGYRANNFYMNKAYLASEDLNYIGPLQVGVFTPPMGLELITSSRDITFMEPAAPLQAIGPPNETGIQIGHPVLNQRATWALGVFGDAPRISSTAMPPTTMGALWAG